MAKHKHADLIKAWADGARIEYLSASGDWHSTSEPTWYETTEYRIKSEPKPDRIYIQNYAEAPDGIWFSSNPEENTQRVKWTIDGETGKIKSVELLDK